jgi:hypothetical protein
MAFPPSTFAFRLTVRKKKAKAIPVKGRGGPLGCETSRFPHFV